MSAGFAWPKGFRRVPAEPWTTQPLGELALKYDTVERHGWYENLVPTEEALEAFLRDGDVLVDYSGGTGILAQHVLRRLGDRRVGIVIADSSAKFLRLALEKLGDDERMAFRWLRYLQTERRLALLDEVLDPPLLEHGVRAVSSTNAIHLYYDLDETLQSWARVLVPGGRAFVQSGNIGNPEARSDEWIIDATVEAIHVAALDLVHHEARWAQWRAIADDAGRMREHDALRRKYFLPVRPLSFYLAELASSGLRLVSHEARRIEAKVDDWYEFLSAYHEGVLGWAGGTSKVEGEDPTPEVVFERLALLRAAMETVFGGEPTFPCCWTYVTAEKP